MNPTRRQFDVAAFIADYRSANGLSPSLEEIAEGLGITKVTVHEHIEQLVRKDMLTRTRYVSRSMVPTPKLSRILRRRGGAIGRMAQIWRMATKAERTEFLTSVGA